MQAIPCIFGSIYIDVSKQYRSSFVQYIDESKRYHAFLVQYTDEWIDIKTVWFNILMSTSDTMPFWLNIRTNGLM